MPRNSGSILFRSTRQSLLGCWAALCMLPCSCFFAHDAWGQPIPTPILSESVAPAPTPLLSSPVPLAVALETRGDLNLQETALEKALITIGASWRVNIVFGKDVKGTVSCIYKQAPLREVLNAILLANGYSYRAVGESLVVQKAQDVNSANPLFESAAISITHSDLEEILEGARLLLSKQGQIRGFTSAKSILVVDYADRVASIRNFIASMDAAASKSTGGIPAETYQRLEVSYFHTQYIPAETAKEALAAVLSQAGRVAAMPAENRLIVVDYASNIAMVRRVLTKIDRPIPQVRITALIYDISLEDVEELGFNWTSFGKGNNLDAAGNPQQLIGLGSLTTGVSGPNATVNPFLNTANGSLFGVQSFTSNFDISVVGKALQNANDARLLANPNVTVMDNETAEMNSVQEIPFQQLTQSGQGGGGAQAIATTAFKPVGVKLRVTPTVASDGTIKLVVEQEFSRVAGFTAAENQPIIDTRIANTTVRVANRKTLVIGGLRQRSDTGDFNGIPYLKDVRFIGPLFRSRNTTVRESELIIFLMPEIVGYDQAGSKREYLAQQTINCRLDRLPMAEGCGGPNGGDCSMGVEGGVLYEGPATQPLGETLPQSIPPAAQTTGPPTNSLPIGKQAKASLRQGFEDRYRAVGETGTNRRMIQESAPRSVKDDSRALLQLLRSKR